MTHHCGGTCGRLREDGAVEEDVGVARVVVSDSRLAEISAAVRLADALTLENKAAELSFVHITNGARHAGVHAA